MHYVLFGFSMTQPAITLQFNFAQIIEIQSRGCISGATFHSRPQVFNFVSSINGPSLICCSLSGMLINIAWSVKKWHSLPYYHRHVTPS